MDNPKPIDPLIIILPILLIVAIAVSIWYFVFRNKCSDNAKPYWNKTTKKCEACPDAKPRWDKTKKECRTAQAQAGVDAGKVSDMTIQEIAPHSTWRAIGGDVATTPKPAIVPCYRKTKN